MDDPFVNCPSQSRSNVHLTQRKGRRATRLPELTISCGADQRIPIEFDQSTGNPLGPNRKKFKSYVALLGRSNASILRKDWDDVEVKVKEQIWQSIMLTYDFPSTDFLKKKWLSFAGERWRAFKTQLTSRYIFGSLKDISPCEKYQFLDEETWEKFVESRQDPAFQEKRKKAQQIQAKNRYPHRLSRGGYELLEERIIQQKLKERHEASQSDPSIIVAPPSPPTRHEKWKRARVRQSGDYTSEETRIVAEKIDSLVEKTSQGTFVPVGRDDILTTAIGRPEHSGRVRAVGRGVGIRQYFGSASRNVHTSGVVIKEELKVIKEEIRQQLRQEIRQELASLGLFQPSTNPQPSHSPASMSTEESCAPEDVSEEDLDTPKRYKEIVELNKDVSSQQSDSEIDPLKRLCVAAMNIAKHPIQPEPKVDPLTRLCVAAMNIAKHPIQLHLEPNVIGKPTSTPFCVTQKDILDVVMGNDLLCISILQVWLLYLYRRCTSKGINDIYGFVDPVHIQNSSNKTNEIQTYIQSRICGGGKECYLAPYYDMGHWQLVIICPRQNIVVFVCSLWSKPSKEFKDLINVAMHACNVLGGRRLTTRKKPTWIFPRSRKQTGSTECGYYVMRHMFNVVSANIIDSWTEIFENPNPFNEEEIDDIRSRLANFLLIEANL